MPRVEVQSRVIGAGPSGGLPNVFFDYHSERLTVRSLLLRSVEEQVRDLNAARELTGQEALRRLARQFQTEEQIVALRSEDRRESRSTHIDLSSAQDHAVAAFTSQRCLMYVDGIQMEDLDQEVFLKPNSTVQFVRLLPLRGGVVRRAERQL